VAGARRYLVVLILFASVGVMAAGAIPLCDYRSPNADISNLGISFAYHYYNDPYGLSQRDIDEGQLLIDYSRRVDTPDFGFDISVNNNMQISTVALSSFLITADGSLKRYFSPDEPYFGLAGVSGKSGSSYKTIGLSVKLGVGYGRFTDVSPLSKAMEIDSYLFDRGTITAHLERIDLEALAHEIDNIKTYDSLTSLLGVLQDIVEGSGVAKAGGLDALDTYGIAQIVQDDSHPRYCGGSLSVGLGYELLDPMNEQNDLLATASFDYAFTTTPKIQFLINGTFSGAYDFMRTNQINVNASYDYLVTSFLDLSFVYTFSRETWDGVPTDKHELTIDVTFTPVKGANIVLSMNCAHEPYFLEWKKDITFKIGMQLL
jgi:hypothetical protein